MKPWILAAALAAATGAAAEETALLPGEAFAVPPPCHVEPFANPTLGQRDESLGRGCGRDRLDVRVDTPRLRPSDTGPDQVVLAVDQVLTRQVRDAFTASARLGWQAATDDGFSRLEHGRALVAAGGRLRLHERWALDLNWGGERAGALRKRTTMTGLWRPRGNDLLFAEVAAADDGIANVVGYRWWVLPRRAVVDLSARRSRDGGMLEPRVDLQLIDFAR